MRLHLTFIHQQRSYKSLQFWSDIYTERKLMEKAEVIQKLIFFTSEIHVTLLIFFSSENNTFWNMYVISSIFSCIYLFYFLFIYLFFILILFYFIIFCFFVL